MEEEDKEFFVLVLGVLAAIILVISWWFTSGGVNVATQRVVGTDIAAQSATEDHGDADTPAVEDAEAGDQDLSLLPADGDPSDGTDTTADLETADDLQEPFPTSVFAAMANRSDLSVITGLFQEEGLNASLAGTGPFTVFVPSDDAVSDAAGSDTTLAVLESARASVLTYHVVPGEYTADELFDIARGSRSAELRTLQGEPLSLSLDGQNIVINGNTVIVGEAIASGNGFVYTVDNVLVPPVASLNALVGLEPILFASGSATIDESSFATLDQFIEVLADNSVGVDIEGHTDSSGDPILNQNLSQSRARAVLNYLVANGIEESRLSATGFGPNNPVADNDSEAGRALNRRIEFSLASG